MYKHDIRNPPNVLFTSSEADAQHSGVMQMRWFMLLGRGNILMYWCFIKFTLGHKKKRHRVLLPFRSEIDYKLSTASLYNSMRNIMNHFTNIKQT